MKSSLRPSDGRLPADECFSGAIIRALREAGFDVTRSAERHPAAADRDVLDLAVREQRVLLTEDIDFGELTMRLDCRA